ncbi:MAG: PilZ domain-containing protein [Thermodesulfobacteriota bacterium]
MIQGLKLPDGAERRRHERFCLKVFGSQNSCTIALDPGTFLDCSILDVSQGGVRMCINSERKGIPAPSQGQAVEFRAFLSARNRCLEGRKGSVAWYDAARREFGVQFEDALPPDHVAGLAAG